MSLPFQLDATDWKILRELQRDGRITNVELAQRVGLSPPPCLRRVQALEKSGAIAGYRAVLNGPLLGFEVQLFAMVGLKSQADAELKAFEARIAGWPLVREAYAISGEADFLLKLRGVATLQPCRTSSFKTSPPRQMSKTCKTTLIMRVSKYEPGVPIP